VRDLAKLPKAHLHLHFTGSMRLPTLRDLAAEHRVRVPAALVDDDPLRVPADERGWFRFQRLYDAARACVRSEADMRRLVDEAAADDASEGSGRLELQVDPTSYAPFVGGITPAVEIVLDAAKAATPRTGSRSRSSSRRRAYATRSTPARSPASRHGTRATGPARSSASG
jgi:adenosine deaminase